MQTPNMLSRKLLLRGFPRHFMDKKGWTFLHITSVTPHDTSIGSRRLHSITASRIGALAANPLGQRLARLFSLPLATELDRWLCSLLPCLVCSPAVELKTLHMIRSSKDGPFTDASCMILSLLFTLLPSRWKSRAKSSWTGRRKSPGDVGFSAACCDYH